MEEARGRINKVSLQDAGREKIKTQGQKKTEFDLSSYMKTMEGGNGNLIEGKMRKFLNTKGTKYRF